MRKNEPQPDFSFVFFLITYTILNFLRMYIYENCVILKNKTHLLLLQNKNNFEISEKSINKKYSQSFNAIYLKSNLKMSNEEQTLLRQKLNKYK